MMDHTVPPLSCFPVKETLKDTTTDEVLENLPEQSCITPPSKDKEMRCDESFMKMLPYAKYSFRICFIAEAISSASYPTVLGILIILKFLNSRKVSFQ